MFDSDSDFDINAMNEILSYLGVALLIIAGIAALTALLAGIRVAKLKWQKEWGLFLRHIAYHPQRPSHSLHFEDYARGAQIRANEELDT